MTEDQITKAALAMRDEASRFNNPVHYYVESEAVEREMMVVDYEADDSEGQIEAAAVESWKILARAALSAIE